MTLQKHEVNRSVLLPQPNRARGGEAHRAGVAVHHPTTFARGREE